MSRLIAPTTLRFGDVAKPGIEPQPAGVGHRHGMPADPTGGLTLAAGTYTPTLTNVANLDASGALVCQYMRVGSVVTVSGKATADPTAGAGTITQLDLSLPIASDFAAQEDAGGAGVFTGLEPVSIFADATNNRVSLLWTTSTTTNQGLNFCFQYRII